MPIRNMEDRDMCVGCLVMDCDWEDITSVLSKVRPGDLKMASWTLAAMDSVNILGSILTVE